MHKLRVNWNYVRIVCQNERYMNNAEKASLNLETRKQVAVVDKSQETEPPFWSSSCVHKLRVNCNRVRITCRDGKGMNDTEKASFTENMKDLWIGARKQTSLLEHKLCAEAPCELQLGQNHLPSWERLEGC